MLNRNRIRLLNDRPGNRRGPVIYWMSRDQRLRDNWAFLYALERAREQKRPLLGAFCWVKPYLEAQDRHYAFMLEGLKQVEQGFKSMGLRFLLLSGDPALEIPRLASRTGAAAIVTDFSPLKLGRLWRRGVAKRVSCPVYEADAHNVVPAWVASPKQEFAAYTLRPKIHRLLPEYLTEFPELPQRAGLPRSVFRHKNHWPSRGLTSGLPAGERAARSALSRFLRLGLKAYETGGNDPNADAQSGLSPYLHFGQLSAQRAALAAMKSGGRQAEAFLEELVVRRELADNFCLYNPHYDDVKGFPAWAQKTLKQHVRDKREHVYRLEAFEHARTHDELWNAIQRQMVRTGKGHGYMRMYWAKKILEWSRTPAAALKTAIYLNDKYELDGRDPNGYAGIAWSIGGVHDRAWGERSIFGKIRYMSRKGCEAKFDVSAYVARWS